MDLILTAPGGQHKHGGALPLGPCSPASKTVAEIMKKHLRSDRNVVVASPAGPTNPKLPFLFVSAAKYCYRRAVDMAKTSKGLSDRRRSLALASLLWLPGLMSLPGCFNSDELLGADDDSGTTTGETGAMYSDETDTLADDNWTAEETGPFTTTCRDAIECLITCQSLAIVDPDPEPDLSCFLECDMGLSEDEAYLLIKLAECIGNKCAESGDCGPDSDDQTCLICIASNANDPQPIGCIEEAAACQ